MKTASIAELKQELHAIPGNTLAELCLRLAKFKKENKELLTYLLFEAHDEQAYISSVKESIDAEFAELPKANMHLTKKSIRKILKTVNKYIRYTASKQAEVELLIYFCSKLKASNISMPVGQALYNLYQGQVIKINKTLLLLHEDLQHDYEQQVLAIAQPNEAQTKKRWLFAK